MTVAFVVGCPIGLAAQIDSSLPPELGPLERALVIGADSRFSSPDGRKTSDLGAKLWHLEAGISAVFAGFVANAELGLSALRRRLRRESSRSVKDLSAWAQECFQNAVPVERRKGIYTTQILIAVRTDQEMCTLRLESAEGFRPLFSTVPELIGDPKAQRAFGHHLIQRIAPVGRGAIIDRKRREVIVSDSAVLHEVAVAALMGAIQDVGGTIGGPLQTAILSGRGTEIRETFAVDVESLDRNAPPIVERLNARPDEVRTLTDREDRRQLEMEPTVDHNAVIGMTTGPDNRLYVTKSGWLRARSTSIDSDRDVAPD